MNRLITIEPEFDLFDRETVTVYLIHFVTPICHAKHYIGSTEDLDRRIHEHRRKWPLYRLDDDALRMMPSPIDDTLSVLCGRNFRRKHTFLTAIHDVLQTHDFDLLLLKLARKHKSNGLLMTANQQHIPWVVAQTWQAPRTFEQKLKRQKNARRYCPVCHNQEPLPF